ncbi:hypothetical protein ES707_18577 [subsurface metagenome]
MKKKIRNVLIPLMIISASAGTAFLIRAGLSTLNIQNRTGDIMSGIAFLAIAYIFYYLLNKSGGG